MLSTNKRGVLCLTVVVNLTVPLYMCQLLLCILRPHNYVLTDSGLVSSWWIYPFIIIMWFLLRRFALIFIRYTTNIATEYPHASVSLNIFTAYPLTKDNLLHINISFTVLFQHIGHLFLCIPDFIALDKSWVNLTVVFFVLKELCCNFLTTSKIFLFVFALL